MRRLAGRGGRGLRGRDRAGAERGGRRRCERRQLPRRRDLRQRLASSIPGQDVKIAGAKVGSVVDVKLTPDHKARIQMQVGSQFAPFRSDADCTIQPQSLIGEKFIQCTPGTPDGTPLVATGGRRRPCRWPTRTRRSTSTSSTRRSASRRASGWRLLLSELGAGFAARGDDLNAAILRANPALQETRRVHGDPERRSRAAARADRRIRQGHRAARRAPRRGQGLPAPRRAGGEASPRSARPSSSSPRSGCRRCWRRPSPRWRTCARSPSRARRSCATSARAAPQLQRLAHAGRPARRRRTAGAVAPGRRREGRRARARRRRARREAAAGVRAGGAADGHRRRRPVREPAPARRRRGPADVHVLRGAGDLALRPLLAHAARAPARLELLAVRDHHRSPGCSANFAGGGATAAPRHARARRHHALARAPPPPARAGRAERAGAPGAAQPAGAPAVPADSTSRGCRPSTCPTCPSRRWAPRTSWTTCSDERTAAKPRIAANPILIGAATMLVTRRRGLPRLQRQQRAAVRAHLQRQGAGARRRRAGRRATTSASAASASARSARSRRSRPPNGRFVSELDLKLEKTVEPLRADTIVTVRPRSTLGLKYLELKPGARGGPLPSGGTLALKQAGRIVELDDVLNAFDAGTRAGIQDLVDRASNGVAGRGTISTTRSPACARCSATSAPVMANLGDPRTALRGAIAGLDEAATAAAPVSAQLGSLVDGAAADAGLARQRARRARRHARPRARHDQPGHRATCTRCRRCSPTPRGSPTACAPAPTCCRRPRAASPTSRRPARRCCAARRAWARISRTLLRAVGALAKDPSTSSAVTKLTQVVASLAPTLRFVNPFQTQCNYLGLWTRNASSTISEGDENGTWFRFIPVFQTDEFLQRATPAPQLHATPYGNATGQRVRDRQRALPARPAHRPPGGHAGRPHRADRAAAGHAGGPEVSQPARSASWCWPCSAWRST